MLLEVNEIINLLHKSVSNKTYDFVPTLKNRNSRRKYGLTLFELEEFLLSINSEDLYCGPTNDYDIQDEVVFIFKKEIIDGIRFYVKVKKNNSLGYDRIKILSCHEDEF